MTLPCNSIQSGLSTGARAARPGDKRLQFSWHLVAVQTCRLNLSMDVGAGTCWHHS